MESSRDGTTERKQGNLIKEGETRHSNPFLADGVLSKKADYIIAHSTITRTELQIADPDSVRRDEAASKSGSEAGGSQPPPSGTTFPVEVEVKQTIVSTPDRQKAEEVQLSKEKKCKCCTVL